MAYIRVEHDGPTVVLSFARPPANAFDLELVRELHAAVDRLATDVPPGGVVLTGDGRIFSGGVDFKAVPAYDAVRRAEMIGHINATVTRVYGLPTATVAAVNGHAIGGAFVIVLACDFRLVADADVRLALTEVTAGIPYPACPMEVVRAEFEPGLRRRLVLGGDPIAPAVARAAGIVDEVAAPGALLPRAIEVARTRSAASAYARVKEQLRGETLARMRAIVASSSDPMLAHWV